MYVLKFGDVWHELDGVSVRVCGASDELAIAYDPETGVVLKHGARAAVEAWRSKFRERVRAAGMGDDLADPTLAAFPAHEAGCNLLNQVADNSTFVEAMIRSGELPGALAVDTLPSALMQR